jgi:hypothetical protein
MPNILTWIITLKTTFHNLQNIKRQALQQTHTLNNPHSKNRIIKTSNKLFYFPTKTHTTAIKYYNLTSGLVGGINLDCINCFG